MVLACGQAAPAETPDEVVAREAALVAAARRRAEEQEKRDRDQAEAQKRADDEARRAADADRKTDSQRKTADCAWDRADRRRHVQDALDRAAKERARAAELEAYVAKSCSRKDVTDYTDQQYVDDSGYVRTRKVANGKHEEIACPADAPPELRPGGSGFPTGVVQIYASADERAKNDRCQDVQDLLKK